MLLQVDGAYKSEAEPATAGSGVADYWWVIIIPLLLCGVVYRQQPGRRPVAAKAMPVDMESGALEAISARAVLTDPESVAFNTVIGGLLAVEAGDAQANPQHAVLGAASFVAPNDVDDAYAVTVEPGVAPIKPIAAVPLAVGKDAMMIRSNPRSASYGNVFKDEPRLLATANRTASYFDILNAEAGDGPSLQIAGMASNPPPGVRFLLPNSERLPLSESFQDRNTLYKDDNNVVRFKSVHRTNPLAGLAKQNRQVAVHPDESELGYLELDGFEEYELHNPMFTSASRGTNLDPMDERAIAGTQNGISRAGLGLQDIESGVSAGPGTFSAGRGAQPQDNQEAHHASEDSVPLARGQRGGQGLNGQSEYLSIEEDGPGVFQGDQGSITGQDEYLAVNTGQAGAPGAGRGNQSMDDQDESLAFDTSGLPALRAGRGGQAPDDQDEYLALDANNPTAVRATRGGQFPDDQDEYLALGGNNPTALLAGRGQSLEDQDEYLALDGNNPTAVRATRGGQFPDDQDEYLAFDGNNPTAVRATRGFQSSDDEDEYLAFDGNPAALQAGLSGQSRNGDSQEEYLAVEDTGQEEYLAINSKGPGAIFSAGRGGQSPDDQDDHLAIDTNGPPASWAGRGGRPNTVDGQEENLAVDDAEEYLAVTAGSGPATDIRYGRSQAQQFVDEDDDGDEYLTFDAGNNPTSWAGRRACQPDHGDRQARHLDVGDEEDEYLAFDAEGHTRTSVFVGRSETQLFGDTEHEQEEYLAVAGPSTAHAQGRSQGRSHTNIGKASADELSEYMGVTGTDDDPDSQRGFMEMPDGRDPVAASSLKLTRTRPRMQTERRGMGSNHPDEGSATSEGARGTRWVVGEDGKSATLSQHRRRSRPISEISLISSGAHLDAVVVNSSVDTPKLMDGVEHRAMGHARRAPNDAAAAQEWRMSTAAWSDADDDDDDEGGSVDGHAVGSGTGTAEAAGGISASMFSAAPRKLGVRPSNRRIGTNFSGRAQYQATLPVQTENVFVADVQAQSVRLASIIRDSPRSPGQTEMAPATMEQEDTA